MIRIWTFSNLNTLIWEPLLETLADFDRRIFHFSLIHLLVDTR